MIDCHQTIGESSSLDASQSERQRSIYMFFVKLMRNELHRLWPHHEIIECWQWN